MLDGGWGEGTMVGSWGVLEDASAPPERRLRSIWVSPVEMGKLWETDGCRPGAAIGRRLLDEGPGEGGEATKLVGGKGGGGESRSTTGEVGGCDWDIPRGRPRRKEVRMFCLEGGKSFPTK